MAVKMQRIQGQDRWIVRVTYQGSTISQLLPPGATKDDARRVEEVLLERLWATAEATQRIIGAPTLADALESYIMDLEERGRSVHSIRHVVASKQRTQQFFGPALRVCELSYDKLHAFQRSLLDQGLSPSTINRNFWDLRAALHVVWPDFQFPKHLFLRERHEIPKLGPHEFEEVIVRLSPPYRVIAELSGLTLMRLSEILGLRRMQVDLSAGVIHLEDRTVVLGAQARRLFEQQLRSHDSEYAFPRPGVDAPLSALSVLRRWRAAVRAAGLTKLPFQWLRLLGIQLGYAQGVAIDHLALLAGWKFGWRSIRNFTVPDPATLRKAADRVAGAMKQILTITKPPRANKPAKTKPGGK